MGAGVVRKPLKMSDTLRLMQTGLLSLALREAGLPRAQHKPLDDLFTVMTALLNPVIVRAVRM
jgi:hypothetical protein